MTSILYSDKPYNLDRTRKINSWTDSRESQFLYNFDRFKLDERPINILEIGSFEGASACWFMENAHYQSLLHLVDQHFNNAFYLNIDTAFSGRCEYYPIVCEGLTKTILPKLVDSGKQFDLIYVDASHDYEDVASDLEYADDMIVPGGYLVLDDYYKSWPGVVQAADEFLNKHPEYTIADKGYSLWLQLS